MMNGAFENSDAEKQAHAKLAEALSGLLNERILVPPSLDQTILAAARTHLDHAARRRTRRRRQRTWLAAAASVALGAWLAHVILHSTTQRLVAREDLDRNGRIDILDAFALARQMERKEKIDLRFDFNGDGVVDRKDIDLIGAKAVALDGKQG